MRQLIAAFLLTAVAGVEAQSGPALKKKAPSKMTDAQLEAAIRSRFAQSKIGTNNFQVRVQGGIATLDGRTDIVQHKGTATRLAKNAGAAGVVNRIQVSEAGRKKASENLAEGRRRAQIKRGDVRSERDQSKTKK